MRFSVRVLFLTCGVSVIYLSTSLISMSRTTHFQHPHLASNLSFGFL